MSGDKLHVLIVTDSGTRTTFLDPADLDRLSAFATVEQLELEGGEFLEANPDPAAHQALLAAVPDADALVVCHGSPRIGPDVLAAAPRLRFAGELEGGRFAHRFDLDALWQRGVTVVDTTHGSSYPVAEWALGLVLNARRNAGAAFREMIKPVEHERVWTDFGFVHGELHGTRVGLLGCGLIGRRLVRYLHAFDCEVYVHDPYLPPETADAIGVERTSLEEVMRCDSVVNLLPITPATERIVGRDELALLRPGSVFVNVGRGRTVDSDALVERLSVGDVTAGLDVFDPEPIPADHPVKNLPTVFLSPHIAGVTRASRTRFFSLMVDELDRFAHGREVRYPLTSRSRDAHTARPAQPAASHEGHRE